MKMTIRSMPLLGALVMTLTSLHTHAQTYTNNFEGSADLGDWNTDTTWAQVGTTPYLGPDFTPLSGQNAYIHTLVEPINGYSSFILNTGFTSNFTQAGDAATFTIWHAGTGSQDLVGFDFIQLNTFLGFSTSPTGYVGTGDVVALYAGFADGDYGPTAGNIGVIQGSGASVTQTQFGASYGPSAAPAPDDINGPGENTWNRHTVTYTYDGNSSFLVTSNLYNQGDAGTAASYLIASRSSQISAKGFAGEELYPMFGMNDMVNLRNAYDTFTYSFAPVPEPASALMGCVGLVGLLIRRRR